MSTPSAVQIEYDCLHYEDLPFDDSMQALAAALEQRRQTLHSQGISTDLFDSVFPAGIERGLTRVHLPFQSKDFAAMSALQEAGHLRPAVIRRGASSNARHCRADWQRNLSALLLVDGTVATESLDFTRPWGIHSSIHSLSWPHLRLLCLFARLTAETWAAVAPDNRDAWASRLDALAHEFAGASEEDPEQFFELGHPWLDRWDSVTQPLDAVLAWKAGAELPSAARELASYQWLRNLWDRVLGMVQPRLTIYALDMAHRHLVSGASTLCPLHQAPQDWDGVPYFRVLRERQRAALAVRKANARYAGAEALPWLDAAGQPLRTVFRQTVPAADHALMLDFGATDSDPDAAFADQANGLLGLQVPGLISLVIGAQHAQVDLTVHLCTAEPPLPSAGWTELVEGDWTLRLAHGDTDSAVEGLVLDIDGMDHGSLHLPPGRYRVRMGFAGFDASAQGEGEPLARCTLALWPRAAEAPAQPDGVLRVQAASARGWHQREGVGP